MKTSSLRLATAFLYLATSLRGSGATKPPIEVTDYADLDGGQSVSLGMTVDCLFQLSGKKPKDGPTPESRHEQVLPALTAVESKIGHPAPFRVEELQSALPAARGGSGKKEEAGKPGTKGPGKADEAKKEKTALEKYDEQPGYFHIPYLTEPRIHIEGTVTTPKGSYPQTKGPSVRDKLVTEEEIEKKTKEGTIIDFYSAEQSSMGPFRIRRTVDEINPALGAIQDAGPDPKIEDAKGAKLNFSDNRLAEGNGAWSSEGALFFPFIWSKEPLHGSDSRIHILPAISWKVQEAQKTGAKDVSELAFNTPLVFDWGNTGDYWTFIATPYYQTDTHFDGGIWGTTASFSYRGMIGGLALNEWMRDEEATGPSYGTKISFKFLGDYSDVQNTSPYSPRMEDDDWFRLGAEIGFSFAFRPSWTSANKSVDKFPFIFSTSYRFMDTLGGKGGYSDLFSSNLTWWMTDYIGLTLEYQNGETPVATQAIDLLSLGLEFRY